MEVTKIKSEVGTYDIYIKSDNKTLSIIFGGNLDLYLILCPREKEEYENIKKSKTHFFVITKENYFIYSVFESLINDIRESKVFIPNKIDNELFCDFDPLSDENYCQKRNEELKETWEYLNLYDGKNIIWHSDEEPYDITNVLKIYKNLDDDIVLEFIRKDLTEESSYIYRILGDISIRIRNSGSVYNPYNIIFMRMYNKLTKYNPEYHQIHIEEYLYQKKRTLKK